MKYQAVVFDLDGTLLDTLTDLWNSVNEACREYGCAPRTRLQVRRALGNGLENLLRKSRRTRTNSSGCSRISGPII